MVHKIEKPQTDVFPYRLISPLCSLSKVEEKYRFNIKNDKYAFESSV